jgi:hypothetical protein
MDTLKAELKKGDYWPQFGFFINKEFSIKTRQGSGRYLDLIGDQVVIKTRTTSKTQKWYFDYNSRTIRNAATNKSVSIASAGRGNRFVVWKTTSEWFQIFRFSREMLVNVKGKVVTISQGDKEGAICNVSKKLYSLNQRFTITYTDKEEKIATTGVNNQFGFHIGRPFYIITKLGSGRAIEVVGGRNLVLK